MAAANEKRARAAVSALAVTWLVSALILSSSAQNAKPPDIGPADIVRQTVARELAPGNGAKHMFRSRKRTPRGSQTRLYVETTDAMAGMVIASDGKPLTPQQEQDQIGHLDWLMNNPEQLRKKHAREKDDEDRTLRIMKALPDAFRYEFAGTEPSTTALGKGGDQLVRLKFTPNPNYSPPSRVEQVLQGMEGYLLIDTQAKRLARIDGTLFRDVSFGWGIFGRLYKGGHFLVQQADVGDGTWEITEMNLNITGKILLFKDLRMISDEVLDDFRTVPKDLSFGQGVELLKKEFENQKQSAHSIEPQTTVKAP